jgi:hypothetical protein
LLEPAAALADEKMELIPEYHLLWVVLDGDELLAAATARLTEDGRCEVPLIGGRDFKRWLKPLDDVIGAAAAEAGATRMTAFGRRGWARELQRHGWAVLSEDADGFCTYARELRN